MPYAPGIQDISGQLIAQGMSQAGAARARAIESLGESISGGIKQYQQNQLYTNQALGKFGQGLTDPDFQKYVNQVVNDDPNAPKVPDALKKAFKNAAAGKVDIYDAALLGSAAEGYAQNRYIAAQTRNLTAEAVSRENEAAMRKAALERLNLFRAGYGGDMTGMAGPQPAERPTVSVAPQVSPEVLKFAATAPVSEPTTAIPKTEAPEAIGTFIQTAKPFAMPKVQAPAPAPAVPAVPGRALAPSLEGGITIEQRKGLVRSGMPMEMVAAIPEQIPMQTVALAYEEYLGQLAQGKPANANTFLKSLREQEQLRRQGLGESREMTLDEVQKAVTEFNRAQQGVAPELRQQALIRPTNRPGYYSFETQKGELSPTEQRVKAQQESEMRMREKMIPSAYDDVRKQADNDAKITPQIRRLKDLYQKGKLEGKALENFKAGAVSILKAFNFDVPEGLEEMQGDVQLGQSLMNALIVPYFDSLKGSTSNKDVELIRTFGPQLSTNPRAALEMLQMMDRRVEYNKAVDRQYKLFNAGRLTGAQLSDSLIELQDKFEASIPEQSEFAGRFNVAAPAQAQLKATEQGATTSTGVSSGNYIIQNGKLVKQPPGR